MTQYPAPFHAARALTLPLLGIWLGLVVATSPVAAGDDNNNDTLSPTPTEAPTTTPEPQLSAKDEARLKALEEEREALKSGQYLRFGASGGVAYAVTAPVSHRVSVLLDGQAEQKSFSSTAMPYVSFFPGYFFGSEVNRAFCAAKWSQDDTKAHKVALEISRDKAEIIVHQLTALAKSGVSLNSESVKRLIPRTYSGISGEDLDAAITQVVATLRKFLSQDASTATLTLAQETQLIDTLAALHWNPSHRPWCWYRSGGIYLGLPQSYQVSSTLVEQDKSTITATRSFNPTISLGFVISPNAYVAILGGLTVGNIPQSTIKPTSGGSNADLVVGQPQRAFSFLLGIGGSLNIVDLFTKN